MEFTGGATAEVVLVPQAHRSVKAEWPITKEQSEMLLKLTGAFVPVGSGKQEPQTSIGIHQCIARTNTRPSVLLAGFAHSFITPPAHAQCGV